MMELDEPIPVPAVIVADGPAAAAPAAPASTSTSATTAAAVGPFDLEAYIGRYAPNSETRLQRLLLVGSASTGSAEADDVGRAAFVMAQEQMRDTSNVRRYREVFGGVQASGGSASASGSGSGEAAAESSSSAAAPEDTSSKKQGEITPSKYGLTFDANFATNTEKTSILHLETLEARLSTAQSQLAKEAIRQAQLALAEFHRLRGDLKESLRRVLRSRDFCTNTRQSGQVCLLVIELGIDMRNYHTVRDYVTKAEHTADLLQTDPLYASKLRVASSLAYLHDGRYAEAARKMATVSSDLSNQFNTVVSAEDIALYGALVALAALDRSELQDLILDSSTFKGRLELIPTMREVLHHYVLAEYGPALSLLKTMLPQLRIDLHLRPHVDALYGMVRDRCIVQYFTPYSKVSLVTMGECFGIPADEMASVVASLLKYGKLGTGTRLNVAEKTLVAESSAQRRRRKRRATQQRVTKLGTNFLNETESMILRLSCIENDIVVGDPRKMGGGGWGGGGGGGGGRRGRSRHHGGGGWGGGGMPEQYHPDASAGGDAAMYGIDDASDSSVEDVMDVDPMHPESI